MAAVSNPGRSSASMAWRTSRQTANRSGASCGHHEPPAVGSREPAQHDVDLVPAGGDALLLMDVAAGDLAGSVGSGGMHTRLWRFAFARAGPGRGHDLDAT